MEILDNAHELLGQLWFEPGTGNLLPNAMIWLMPNYCYNLAAFTFSAVSEPSGAMATRVTSSGSIT